ncbi:MAG: D-2-hydroxyacid dehydrogenase [Alphaproteobacteria bacterium]|nr:D-2-hydroxyacid dehydrogenase [Alphaproteobacteria bacterium]MBU0798813.1 D-2-hydroxyacid dehydrogenase [Alphaproteobacteria bacterium]MBU0886997.1 D-2-hydroxyacid dehydrogenase [Alphaproteobacteria bacterium]MBU1813147.1 D-2-hydroxyacid dehydrogenase [Alphaproteobacteria bacterium]
MRSGKINLYVESLTRQPPVFHITPERYARVAARLPEIASRIEPVLSFDGEKFAANVARADVIVGWDFDRQAIRAQAENLALVHITGAGLDHLRPFDWLPPKAKLTNNSGVHGEKAGEFAFMSVLMLNNHMPQLIHSQAARKWDRAFASISTGKTLLIIGVGHMGAEAARYAHRNGLHVLGIRRSGKANRYVHEMGTPDRLHEFLPRADFVVVTAPAVEETKHLIGAAELALMKDTAGLVNMARAHLVDYVALSRVLESGRLAGAVLDVFSPEPLPAESPLWGVPRLILTPHCSSDDAELYAEKTLELVFRNIERLLAGRKPRNVVDLSRGY